MKMLKSRKIAAILIMQVFLWTNIVYATSCVYRMNNHLRPMMEFSSHSFKKIIYDISRFMHKNRAEEVIDKEKLLKDICTRFFEEFPQFKDYVKNKKIYFEYAPELMESTDPWLAVAVDSTYDFREREHKPIELTSAKIRLNTDMLTQSTSKPEEAEVLIEEALIYEILKIQTIEWFISEFADTLTKRNMTRLIELGYIDYRVLNYLLYQAKPDIISEETKRKCRLSYVYMSEHLEQNKRYIDFVLWNGTPPLELEERIVSMKEIPNRIGTFAKAEGGMMERDTVREWAKEGDIGKLIDHITRGLEGQSKEVVTEDIEFILENLDESKHAEFIRALKSANIQFSDGSGKHVEIRDIKLHPEWRHDGFGRWFRGLQEKFYLKGGRVPVVLMDADIPQPILESRDVKDVEVLINYDRHLDWNAYKSDRSRLRIGNSVTALLVENPSINFVINFANQQAEDIDVGYSDYILYQRNNDGMYFLKDSKRIKESISLGPEDIDFSPEDCKVVRRIKVFYAKDVADLAGILKEDIEGKKVYAKVDLDCNRYLSLDRVRQRAKKIAQFNPIFYTISSSVEPVNAYIEEVRVLPYAYTMLKEFGYEEQVKDTIKDVLGVDINQIEFPEMDREALMDICCEVIGLTQYLRVAPKEIWNKVLELIDTKPKELKKDGFLTTLKNEIDEHFDGYRKLLREGLHENDPSKIRLATDWFRGIILSPFYIQIEGAINALNYYNGSERALQIIKELENQESHPIENVQKLKDELENEGFLVRDVGVWLRREQESASKEDIKDYYYEVRFRYFGRDRIYMLIEDKENGGISVYNKESLHWLVERLEKEKFVFKPAEPNKVEEKYLGPASILGPSVNEDTKKMQYIRVVFGIETESGVISSVPTIEVAVDFIEHASDKYKMEILNNAIAIFNSIGYKSEWDKGTVILNLGSGANPVIDEKFINVDFKPIAKYYAEDHGARFLLADYLKDNFMQRLQQEELKPEEKVRGVLLYNAWADISSLFADQGLQPLEGKTEEETSFELHFNKIWNNILLDGGDFIFVDYMPLPTKRSLKESEEIVLKVEALIKNLAWDEIEKITRVRDKKSGYIIGIAVRKKAPVLGARMLIENPPRQDL